MAVRGVTFTLVAIFVPAPPPLSLNVGYGTYSPLTLYPSYCPLGCDNVLFCVALLVRVGLEVREDFGWY